MLILLLATTVTLAVAEWVASWYVVLPSDGYVRDARLNHTWPPESATEHREWAASNPEWPQPYTHYYNRQGWIESYDVAAEKPSGTYRIFYLGDSFTEGCVPMDESVPSRVEAYLNQESGESGYRFEVINTGTSSYSPIIYYILVRYFIQEYDPDAIVVNVDMTDDFDDWKYRQTLITDRAGNPFAAPPRHLYKSRYVDTLQGAVRAGPLARLHLFLIERSHLYNAFRGDRAVAAALPPGEEEAEGLLYPRWAWCAHEWDEATEESVALTLDVLARLCSYCRRNGIRVMLTGVPHYQQFERASDGRADWSRRPHREIERVAGESSAAYLDSYEALRPMIAGSEQHEYYYRGNMHFNPRGNALWAEAHLREITDPGNGMLPEEVYRELDRR